MMFERICEMLKLCDGEKPVFPPTLLFNENWMLRLVLDWCSQHPDECETLRYLPGSRWFSGGLLPSAFLARKRGDVLAETWTHADGLIGHFAIGSAGKGDVMLLPDATQFTVVEGKMFSPLSRETKRIANFDQAARSVACIAETLRRGQRSPNRMSLLSFVVVAPASQIAAGLFADKLTSDSIKQNVTLRVAAYEGQRDTWMNDWFLPTLSKAKISTLSWEDSIQCVSRVDDEYGRELERFYDNCLKFNQPRRSRIKPKK